MPGTFNSTKWQWLVSKHLPQRPWWWRQNIDSVQHMIQLECSNASQYGAQITYMTNCSRTCLLFCALINDCRIRMCIQADSKYEACIQTHCVVCFPKLIRRLQHLKDLNQVPQVDARVAHCFSCLLCDLVKRSEGSGGSIGTLLALFSYLLCSDPCPTLHVLLS